MTPKQEEFLFVYGTLRRAGNGGVPHPMHRVVASHCRFVGTGTCRGKLYELGGYPGLVLTSQAAPPVKGELYQVLNPDSLWPLLDAYEDCDPDAPGTSEYRREQIPVVTGSNNTLSAWTYLYNRPVVGKRPIASGDYTRFG